MKNKKKNNIINFPATPSKIERQVEAILFAASEPLDIETIEKRIQTSTDLKKILENLKKIYEKRGINLVCIKNNLDKIMDWKDLMKLIPQFYLSKNMERTGIAGIFAASLELTREGIVSISQNKSFDKLMIKKTNEK